MMCAQNVHNRILADECKGLKESIQEMRIALSVFQKLREANKDSKKKHIQNYSEEQCCITANPRKVCHINAKLCHCVTQVVERAGEGGAEKISSRNNTSLQRC